MLPTQVNLFIPIGRVQKCYFVFIEPGNNRPRPVVEDAQGIDHNITVVLGSLVLVQVLNLDIVSALFLVPNAPMT